MLKLEHFTMLWKILMHSDFGGRNTSKNLEKDEQKAGKVMDGNQNGGIFNN